MKQSYTSRESSTRGQALAILGLVLFCLPLISAGLRRAEFDGRPVERRDAATPSIADNELLLTWQGSELGDSRIEALRTKLLGQVAADGLLRGGSPFVKDVVSAGDVLQSMSASEVDTNAKIASLGGVWLGRGGVKIRATSSGRKDLDWTAKRIETELKQIAGRDVRVVVRPVATVDGDVKSAVELPPYDLEVFCTSEQDSQAIPLTLRDELLAVRGYPTSSEPDGQRLVEEVLRVAGTPIAVRVRLSEAGRAEPTLAVGAIREAAATAEIPVESVLVSGPGLESAERAQALRSSVWTTQVAGREWPVSPVMIAFAGAAALGLLFGGVSVEFGCSLLMGAFGAALMTAAINLMGIAWSEDLLLIPALIFALTVATTLLEPALDGNLSVRVRKPMSASTALCVLCLVVLLAGSNMQRFTERRFALTAALACGLSWGLSTICVPALTAFFARGTTRRKMHGHDFAEWIVRHQRITATVAGVVGIVSALVLMQPGIQTWVAAPRNNIAGTNRYEIERSLTGTSSVVATIRFDSEMTQRLRFLDRAAIVREVTAKMGACPAVTGVMSLAQLAPEVTRPGDDAKTRERNAYLVRSNRVADDLRSLNSTMGGTWLTAEESEDGGVVGRETWEVRTSIAQLTAVPPAEIVAGLHRAVQSVLRFHAGVSHDLTGELVDVAAYSRTPSRRPAMVGLMAAMLILVSSIGTGSLGRGLIISGIVGLPGIAVLVVPGFQPGQFGVAAFLSIGLPLSLGVLSCVRLVNDLGEWSAATSTRHEAIAFALTGSTNRSRQALVTLAALLGGLSVLAPEVMPAAVRAGVWVTAWAMSASLIVFPLVLSGRLGRLVVRDAERIGEQPEEHIAATPIRLEPAIETPHFELEPTRRRVRNAG